jgi:hypothetical protein
MQFSNFKAALSLDDRTARFTIDLMEGRPVLIVKPAGAENKPFLNAMLRESGTARELRQNRISADQLEKNRDMIARLYPEHVVVGWERVVNNAGETVPFSKEACAELLAGLVTGGAGYVLDELASFCGEPANFIPMTGRPAAQINAEAVAGN